jgi:uncharacterized oligopeptide transporter (OPT) family protein
VLPAPRSRFRSRRELTARAVAAGCLIGALLAAGNVYTGLKTGFIDSGAMTATLVSFAMLHRAWAGFGGRAPQPRREQRGADGGGLGRRDGRSSTG